jgi:PPOX class probable F420-dependent enzyme
MRTRLGVARVARLATVTRDGAPHVVPCCFALEGDTIYSAVDAKPKSTLQLQRLANIRAHPRASLVVDHYDDDWSQLWWVRVDGNARVIESTNAIESLQAKYQQYVATPPPGPIIEIMITRWRGWEATSFGA